MKALVYTGPQSLDIRDVPDPVPGADEALIKVEAVGICGSDMHAYLGHDERRPAPLILGHEAAGTIVTGEDSGRRVTINPLVTCMECPSCLSGRTNLCASRQIISMPPREGAFAQFVAIPRRNLVNVPDGFPIRKAALCEPLACSWHAVKHAARAFEGAFPSARCLVVGGGAIGLGAALALHAFGARDITITELNPVRRKRLSELGEFTVIDPGSEALGCVPDIVIDAYGGEASRAFASSAAAPGGVIVHIGLASGQGGLDMRRVTLQEITVIGTYTYTMTDFRETFDAMVSGALGSLDWFETRELADGASSFASILGGRIAAPKIVLEPN